MFFEIIKTIIISLILIFLIHYLFLFFKDNLTIPKTKDLVAKPLEKYKTMDTIINNNLDNYNINNNITSNNITSNNITSNNISGTTSITNLNNNDSLNNDSLNNDPLNNNSFKNNFDNNLYKNNNLDMKNELKSFFNQLNDI